MENIRNISRAAAGVSRIVAMLTAGALIVGMATTMAQAEIYVAGTNGGGTLYKYSTAAGLQGSVAVPGINNIAGSPYNSDIVVATSDGTLERFDSNLGFLGVNTGGNLGTVFDLAVRPDNGDALVAYAGTSLLGHWNASGVFQGQFGSGFTGVKLASGTDGKTWATYNNGGTYYTWIFDQSYGVFQANSSIGAGQEMLANPITGQMWIANDQNGNVGRYSANGVFIDQVGSGFFNPHLAVAGDGKVWIASDSSLGSLSYWLPDGTFGSVVATALGTTVDLVVDPVTGDVVMGLADGSPYGDLLRFNSAGVFLNSLGSNLGIVELAAVPEPATLALLAMGGLLLWRRTGSK